MFKSAKDFTDKEIMYGIMVTLMQIEGHVREYIMMNSDIEYIDGGDENESEPTN